MFVAIWPLVRRKADGRKRENNAFTHRLVQHCEERKQPRLNHNNNRCGGGSSSRKSNINYVLSWHPQKIGQFYGYRFFLKSLSTSVSHSHQFDLFLFYFVVYVCVYIYLWRRRNRKFYFNLPSQFLVFDTILNNRAR